MRTLHVTCSELGPGRRGRGARRRGPAAAGTLLCLFLLVTAVSCDGDSGDVGGPDSGTTGALEVRTETTGSGLDADGYTVTVDGTQSQSIGANGSVTFTGLAAAVHDVELSGVSSNCAAGSNPRAVTVPAGGTVSTSFEIACTAALSGQIVFTTDRDGNFDIYVMDVDGSNPVNLTNHPAFESSAAISPNGAKIAFSRAGDIYVMEADGTNVTNLTNDPATDLEPAWSPDGTKIAFGREGDIYVMNADGSNPVRLTDGPASDEAPAWSPDGTKIAFSRDADIYVMDADGSNPVNLTNDAVSDYRPAWSPDGTKIAFRSDREGGNPDIWSMNADGSNLVRVTGHPASEDDPAWSPDGTKIAFEREVDIYVIDAAGGMDATVVNLTNTTALETEPTWSP